jgi:hypothetical protein
MIRRGASVLAIAVIVVAWLAGCAGTPAPSGVAVDMQSAVVAVAEAAAAGDSAGALAELDGLQQQLDDALAEGAVSAERAAAIQSALDLVRADLQPVPVPTVEPPADPTVGSGDDSGGDDSGGDDSGDDSNPGKGNGNGDGNSGNGNGNSGNGNGNSGNGNGGNGKGNG